MYTVLGGKPLSTYEKLNIRQNKNWCITNKICLAVRNYQNFLMISKQLSDYRKKRFLNLYLEISFKNHVQQNSLLIIFLKHTYIVFFICCKIDPDLFTVISYVL